MDIKEDNLLTIDIVKGILHKSNTWIYKEIRDGRLKAHRLGTDNVKKNKYNRHHWSIKESDLVEYIKEHKFISMSSKTKNREERGILQN